MEQSKAPIFIGSKFPEVINKIDKLIQDNEIKFGEVEVTKDSFELVVISPQILERLEDQYFLTNLQEDARNAILLKRQNEVERNKALSAAMTLQRMIQDYHAPSVSDTFDRLEVKKSIEMANRSKISNSETDNLIEFLALHNFIQPIELEAKSHKRKWVFTFSNQDKLRATQELRNQVDYEIQTLLHQMVGLDDDISNLKGEINDEKEVDKLLDEAVEIKSEANGGSVQALSAEEIEEMNQIEHDRSEYPEEEEIADIEELEKLRHQYPANVEGSAEFIEEETRLNQETIEEDE